MLFNIDPILQSAVLPWFIIVTIWCSTFVTMQTPSFITWHLIEECSNGTVVGNLAMEIGNFDVPSNQNTKYKLISQDLLQYFNIHAAYGIITTIARIDREQICKPKSLLKNEDCKISGPISITNNLSNEPKVITLSVVIDDINDCPPEWRSNSIKLDIPEHTAIKTKFNLPSPTDLDNSPDNVTVNIYIFSQSVPGAFTLLPYIDNFKNKAECKLVVATDLDREKLDSYSVIIHAKDGGAKSLTGTLTVNINVTDINDHYPTLVDDNQIANVNEDTKVKAVIYTVHTNDKDLQDQKRYPLFSIDQSADNDVISTFDIDNTGSIFLISKLDYEVAKHFEIPITVSDGQHFTSATIQVNVVNVNDNAPDITVHIMNSKNGAAVIKENLNDAQFIATVKIDDKDVNGNDDISLEHKVDCKLSDNAFELKLRSGGSKTDFSLYVNRAFNRETEPYFNLTMECTDKGVPSKSSRQVIAIKIEDENDSPPIFSQPYYVGKVKENEPADTKILKVFASDADEGDNANITYFLQPTTENTFTIDTVTGQITSKVEFDAERQKSYNFTVIARDNPKSITPGQYPYGINNDVINYNSATASVVIEIEDTNDCLPIFNQSSYEFSVPENTKRGKLIGKVAAIDEDSTSKNNRITFSLYKESNSIKALQDFDVTNKGDIFVRNERIDRESTPIYSFVITASDEGFPPSSSTASILIRVSDLNDNAPQWIFPNKTNRCINITSNGATGQKIAQLIATDSDDGTNGEVEYFIVARNDQNLFDIDGGSGQVFLARGFVSKDLLHLFKLNLEARDKGSPPQKASAVLEIFINGKATTKNIVQNGGDSDLIILIIIVASTLSISVILIFIILLLRCGLCRKIKLFRKTSRTRFSCTNKASGYYSEEMPLQAMRNKAESLERRGMIISTETKFQHCDLESLDSSRGCSSDAGGNNRFDKNLQRFSSMPSTQDYKEGRSTTNRKFDNATLGKLGLNNTTNRMSGRYTATWNENVQAGNDYQNLSCGGGKACPDNNRLLAGHQDMVTGIVDNDVNSQYYARTYTTLLHGDRVSSPNLYSKQSASYV